MRDIAEVDEREPQRALKLLRAIHIDDAVIRPRLWVVIVIISGIVEDVLESLVRHLLLRNQPEVRLGVCVEDGIDDDVAHVTARLRVKVHEDRGGRISSNFEEPRAMHVLQGRAIIVAERQVVLGLDEEVVALPKVPDVVAESGHRQREECLRIEESVHLAHLENAVQRECHIHRVHPVVEGHRIRVTMASSDLIHKGIDACRLAEGARPGTLRRLVRVGVGGAEERLDELKLLLLRQLHDVESPRLRANHVLLVGLVALLVRIVHSHRSHSILDASALRFCIPCSPSPDLFEVRWKLLDIRFGGIVLDVPPGENRGQGADFP
mmetsp:Transcript_136698/g.292009  ORF Transcript_136698/g.292009 Transcript_136698/m.292009 type:complete len:323 (-) Transcript_136698:835-1803(-)